jgi:CheY-like chemotaxis protein
LSAYAQLRLLVVEDSPADVFLVREAVREEGLECEVEVAEDGESALAILNRVDSAMDDSTPNLVLLDLNLPRTDGIDVLRRLRQSPRCAGIPAIVISSSDSPQDREQALKLGANEYFRKPSSLDEFMRLGKLIRTLHERKLKSGLNEA